MDTTKAIIKMWVDGYAEDNFYQWAIVLKNNEDKPIGTISARFVKQIPAIKA